MLKVASASPLLRLHQMAIRIRLSLDFVVLVLRKTLQRSCHPWDVLAAKPKLDASTLRHTQEKAASLQRDILLPKTPKKLLPMALGGFGSVQDCA